MSGTASTPEVDIKSIEQHFGKELERIAKLQWNYLTINEVLFSYGQLRQLGSRIECDPGGIPLAELLLANETLTTSVVVAYGRLFTNGTGTTKLDDKKIPTEHKAAHEEIMKLRHERYAHNGGHEAMTKSISLKYQNEEIVVMPEHTTGLYIGGADAWEPLFLWINRHLLETTQKHLEFLSGKTDIKWTMHNTPAPSWMDELFENTPRNK